MPYPYPNVTSTGGGSYEYFQYIVGVEPLFFPILLIVIWAVAFISTIKFGASRGYIFASFLTMVLAIMGKLMGFVSTQIMIMTILMTAIGIFFLRIEGSLD